ncbi:DoxX family protein [Frigidibacter sp. MR17.24]|uniref:DoxX family protein n=1 Tax=Frigidibacter sp. MR17.24 TaxID=3127345 RepID=UPI003012B283
MPAFWTAQAPLFLSLMRIIVGAVMLNYGCIKVLGLPAGRPLPTGSLLWIAGCLQLAGGVALVLGWRTRLAAALLMLLTASAYYLQNWPRDWYPVSNGGAENAALFAALLYLSAAGAGSLAVDRAR